MREILFRGKRLDIDERAEGYFIDEIKRSHTYIGYLFGVDDGRVHDTECAAGKFRTDKKEMRYKMRLEPRKLTDKGGYLIMPLVQNVPRPSDKNWKKAICPSCGKECWDRPLTKGFTEEMFDGRLCTVCALQTAGL